MQPESTLLSMVYSVSGCSLRLCQTDASVRSLSVPTNFLGECTLFWVYILLLRSLCIQSQAYSLTPWQLCICIECIHALLKQWCTACFSVHYYCLISSFTPVLRVLSVVQCMALSLKKDFCLSIRILPVFTTSFLIDLFHSQEEKSTVLVEDFSLLWHIFPLYSNNALFQVPLYYEIFSLSLRTIDIFSYPSGLQFSLSFEVFKNF